MVSRLQCDICGEVPVKTLEVSTGLHACTECQNAESWSVFVGGGEVHDHYMQYRYAKMVAQHYIDGGYDDVAIAHETH